MARFVHVEGFTEGIDPILVPPVRLLIAILLVDQRWHEYATLREKLGLEPAVLSKQLATLRLTGYVITRPATDGRRSEWLILDRGIDRLTAHLTGWHRLTVTASEALSANRPAVPRSSWASGFSDSED
ncbi:transcriptional regulator [Amycolatopsis sp. NPDC051903]|uniref:transcriptional regulator n=1 Tax=Amycolatopsis sp. NPDC051903 TaxID=3363936 RepID=UPI0037BDB94C